MNIKSDPIDTSLLDFGGQYIYAKEEIDPKFPKPIENEINLSVFYDSDYAHDKVTRRSISGIIILLGSTLIIWKSK
jgi:hypothetical protein